MRKVAAYSLFTKRKTRKTIGDPLDVGTVWPELIAGLDALGLDGFSLVVGNSRDDLPEDGGFFDAELGEGVVKQYAVQLQAVTFDAFLTALQKTRSVGNEEQASLATHFATLQQVYAKAVAERAGLDIAARDP